MSNDILLKRGIGVPASLSVGEPALDQTNGNLYVGTDSGVVLVSGAGGITKDATISIAKGASQGLEQALLANDGQPARTVLAVGFTSSGKVQGVSLSDGNVVEVYASGSDYLANNVLYREFMSLGEPICFTGLNSGAIITSTQGFYGVSEQVNGSNESPMPLLSLGLSFTDTFFYAFRNSTSNEGRVRVVNGALTSSVTLYKGNGTVVLGQENIVLDPWEYLVLQTDGNTEYRLVSSNNIMACVHAEMDTNRYYDSRLIMPVTNDGITWPRSGFVSAPYDNTIVSYYVRDGASGLINGTTGVSPGSPIDFDSGSVGTGANDTDYEPNGATRVRATGLISAYSGADSAGLEASPLMPTSGLSQIVAQPFNIVDNGDGGNSGVAIASPYEGTAKIYAWNTATNTADLAYTVPLTRTNVTISEKKDQYYPCAGMVANETVNGAVTLSGTLLAGYVIADVPITVVSQSGVVGSIQVRSQNGTTTREIACDDDETLMLGHTPLDIKCEIREDQGGLLRKRVINSSGTESWVLA